VPIFIFDPNFVFLHKYLIFDNILTFKQFTIEIDFEQVKAGVLDCLLSIFDQQIKLAVL